jgi:hypothetical protein
MFLTSIYLIFSMIILKLVYFFYKIITLDYSQLLNTINKSHKKCIICVYGHTSYLDAPISVYVTMKLNMLSLATIKYKWAYPTCLHKYLYFVKKNTKTSEIKINKPLALMIEGTRHKQDCIKTGFYYIAKNNNADIIYMVVDFTNNKIRCTERIDINDYPTINSSLLNPLKNLVSTHFRYSVYPNHTSLIKFKDT